jgi:hypothetical protein
MVSTVIFEGKNHRIFTLYEAKLLDDFNHFFEWERGCKGMAMGHYWFCFTIPAIDFDAFETLLKGLDVSI